MLETHLADLLDGAPPAIGDALDLVNGFDDVLVHGFARLTEEHAGALAALADGMAGTPLGERVAEAVGKVAAGSIGDEHLAVLAGARTALMGALHDALLAGFDTALGRTRQSWGFDRPGSARLVPRNDPDQSPAPAGTGVEVGVGAAGPGVANLLAGCRSWLHELAIAGWRGVDHDIIAASSQLVEAMLAEPGLRRLAVLLDGLVAELRASSPIATMEHLPVRRWADLWTRALLLSQPGGLPVSTPVPVPKSTVDVRGAETLSGRLLILGVDVHEHGTAVQAQVHGILEPSGDQAPRLVRTSVGAAKVDTIVGPSVWRLLRGCPVLLGALAEHRALDLTDMPLLSSGDLVWRDDRASVGEPSDPFATARVLLAAALAPPVPPLDRHPVRIAEPVLLEGYAVTVHDGGSLTLGLGGHTVSVAVDRMPDCGPLTQELVAASSACLGLMRWDGGGWALSPLAVRATVKRKTVDTHSGDWALGPTDTKVVKAGAKHGDAVAVLRERAGRLLRR
ncbi:hypothetical protein [Rugosimonospora africana]|uniref:Uncharacterized protein n=1 Tax=Rugosimonospora africana TaxID=556532 RepID=A0A8J3QNB4_9ACTN|nr:hypothetical protein [Rugosimonospora africana]GIH14163.1 hypothetical protein Raf01_23350 [Rugosimonospora africana]